MPLFINIIFIYVIYTPIYYSVATEIIVFFVMQYKCHLINCILITLTYMYTVAVGKYLNKIYKYSRSYINISQIGILDTSKKKRIDKVN